MTDIVIVSAVRTPVGAFLGGLSGVPADQLGATVIQEALARAKVDAAEVSDVVLGQVLTAGQGQNPARQAAIKAGLPKETPAITINQVCGSGLRAVAMGYQAIKAGDAGIVLAGGQESMSLSTALRLPAHGPEDGRARVRRHHDQGRALGRVQRLPHGHHGREHRPAVADHPRAAGPVRRRNRSERRARRQKAGRFQDEIVPVTVKTRKGDVVVDTDEYPKPGTTAESLAEAARQRSARTARSPPATPPGSTTAPRSRC